MAELNLAKRVREVVLRELARAPRGTVVLLSGGADSQAVLTALLELDRRPHAASFMLEDTESRDHRIARETAAELGVPFHSIPLSVDLEDLHRYVEYAIKTVGLRKKADIECYWPRMEALRRLRLMGYDAVATGDGGDGYFGLSKKAMINYKDDVVKLDAYRQWYFDRPNWSQTDTIRAYAEELGLRVFFPLAHTDLLLAFTGRTWDEVNKPRQKEPLRVAFGIPDRIPRHTNLQLGDSGIADLFSELTPAGARSAVTLYNQIARDVDAQQGSLY